MPVPIAPIPVSVLAPAGVRLAGNGGAGALAVRSMAGSRVAYRLDAKALRARLKRLTPEVLGQAAVETLRAVMGKTVDYMELLAPVSTGRYLAAWQRASNQAGCWAQGVPNPSGTGRAVRAVRANPLRDQIIQNWGIQIEQIRARLIEIEGVLDAWYYSQGRPLNRWARLKAAQARTLERRLARSIEELRRFEADEGALVFNTKIVSTTDADLRGRSGKAGVKLLLVRGRTFFSTRQQMADPGRGLVVVQGARAELWLVNREPHARIVEQRTGLAGRARAFAAGWPGARQLGRAKLGAEIRARIRGTMPGTMP